MIRQLIFGVVAIGITVGASLARERIVTLTRERADVGTAARLLRQMPDAFGSWRTEPAEPESLSVDRDSLIHRSYVHVRTGNRFDVEWLIGSPGEVGDLRLMTEEHSCAQETLCALRGGMVLQRERVSTHGQFWSATAPSGDCQHVRATWFAWSDGESWQASNDANWALQQFPYVYQLSVRPLDSMSQAGASAGCRWFLADYLKMVQTHLNPAPRSPLADASSLTALIERLYE